jgi:uncharacterized membrane protein YdjX (TVP38/TMEM64 family)
MKVLWEKLKSYKDIIENLLGLILVFAGILILFQFFKLSEIQSFVDRFGVWAPVIFMLSKAATLVFAPLSGSALYPAAGALFGFWEGLIALTIGDLVGGTIAFYISRHYGIKITERFIKGESSLMKKILDRLGTVKGFIFARICFIPMPEIVCYAAGLTKMSYWEFIIVHLLIDIPVTALFVGAGTLLTFHFTPLIIFGLLVAGTVATVVGGMVFYRWTK